MASSPVEQCSSEAANTFLLGLSDRLRHLGDPEEIKAAAARALGESLRANRVIYAEAEDDGESCTFNDGYLDGAASAAGRHRYADFDRLMLDACRDGRTHVRRDIQGADDLTAAQKA